MEFWACVLEHKTTHSLYDTFPKNLDNEIRAHESEFLFAERTYGVDDLSKIYVNKKAYAVYKKWKNSEIEIFKKYLWEEVGYNDPVYEMAY